jgi:hypothetical protein
MPPPASVPPDGTPPARPWGDGIIDPSRPLPSPRTRRRKRTIVAIIVLLLLALGWRVNQVGPGGPDFRRGNGPASRQSVNTVPTAFDGSWKGDGHQPPSGPATWTIEIDLDEGKRTGSMKIEGADFSCDGQLTFKGLSGEVLRMDSVVDDRSSIDCADAGRFSLTVDAADPEQLQFSWVDAKSEVNTAGGVLRKD